MGLIRDTLKGATNAVKDLGNSASGGLLGGFTGALNQALYQEYYVSGDMSGDILMKRAERAGVNNSANIRTDVNIITSGSVIDVQHNQCMIIVENGAIVEACSEPGRFVYDTTIAPSFFGEGTFTDKAKNIAKEMWEQAKMGGHRKNTQRIYFINMGILDTPFMWGLGNVPFRHCSKIADHAPAIRINMMLKANGIAKLRIVDPVAFFQQKGAQKAGGDTNAIIRFAEYQDTLFAPAKTSIREAIASAVSQISHQTEIAYTQILSPENADLFRELANKRMANCELAQCGFGFAEFNVNGGFMPRDEDMERLMDMEEKLGTSAFMASDLNMANYDIQKTMARGFENAGQNGGVSGIMGMGMAMGGGIGSLGNIQGQQQHMHQQPVQPMQQAQPVHAAVAAAGWQCSCGHTVNGNFCPNCGQKKPEPKPANSWKCECGQVNEMKFCSACGKKKPDVKGMFICDKCGWAGDASSKFCPNCGDVVDEADMGRK